MGIEWKGVKNWTNRANAHEPKYLKKNKNYYLTYWA